MKAGLDGGAPAALVSLGAGHNFTQLVVSPTTAYWLNLASPYILSVPLAGGSVTTFYYDQNLYPIGIGIDSANVYYTEETGLGPVMACPLDGGTPTMLATNNGTQSVVSDGTNVYYTSPNGNAPTFDGAVLRVPVDGGAAVTLATGGAPQAIAVDGASAYFSRALDGTVVRVTPK
jgi:hypothetical protein